LQTKNRSKLQRLSALCIIESIAKTLGAYRDKVSITAQATLISSRLLRLGGKRLWKTSCLYVEKPCDFCLMRFLANSMSHLRQKRASLSLVGRQKRLPLSDGIQRVQFSEPIRVLNNDLQELHDSACFSALWNSVPHACSAFTEFPAKEFDIVSGSGD
jgi:hypothetical protein